MSATQVVCNVWGEKQNNKPSETRHSPVEAKKRASGVVEDLQMSVSLVTGMALDLQHTLLPARHGLEAVEERTIVAQCG